MICISAYHSMSPRFIVAVSLGHFVVAVLARWHCVGMSVCRYGLYAFSCFCLFGVMKFRKKFGCHMWVLVCACMCVCSIRTYSTDATLFIRFFLGRSVTLMVYRKSSWPVVVYSRLCSGNVFVLRTIASVFACAHIAQTISFRLLDNYW